MQMILAFFVKFHLRMQTRLLIHSKSDINTYTQKVDAFVVSAFAISGSNTRLSSLMSSYNAIIPRRLRRASLRLVSLAFLQTAFDSLTALGFKRIGCYAT